MFVICGVCGTCKPNSRILKLCPIHPLDQDENDFQNCRYGPCGATQNYLKEISIPRYQEKKDENQNILDVKVNINY